MKRTKDEGLVADVHSLSAGLKAYTTSYTNSALRWGPPAPCRVPTNTQPALHWEEDGGMLLSVWSLARELGWVGLYEAAGLVQAWIGAARLVCMLCWA